MGKIEGLNIYKINQTKNPKNRDKERLKIIKIPSVLY